MERLNIIGNCTLEILKTGCYKEVAVVKGVSLCTFRGSTSSIFLFLPPYLLGAALKGKNLLLLE